jgi:hypothetical protein
VTRRLAGPKCDARRGVTGAGEHRIENILPGRDETSDIRADDDGRFAVEGLVPGLHDGATSRSGFEAPGMLFKDVVVAPGEAKDLVDLRVQPPKKQESDHLHTPGAP